MTLDMAVCVSNTTQPLVGRSWVGAPYLLRTDAETSAWSPKDGLESGLRTASSDSILGGSSGWRVQATQGQIWG